QQPGGGQPRARTRRRATRGRARQGRLRRGDPYPAGARARRGRLHGRRPARPDRAAHRRLRRGPGQRAPLDPRPGALDHALARRRRRGARTVRPDPVRPGPRRCTARGPAGMNWRLWLILALLTGALLSGWFAWHGDAPAVEQTGETVRSDYILRDFEVVTLDSSGQESFSLRAPELQQTPGARTLELVTPLFLMPDQHGSRWEVRSKTGWVNEKSTLVQLRGDVVADSPM